MSLLNYSTVEEVFAASFKICLNYVVKKFFGLNFVAWASLIRKVWLDIPPISRVRRLVRYINAVSIFDDFT